MTVQQLFDVLSSFPNNPHHLRRYVRFVTSCNTANLAFLAGGYYENHHILPKHKNKFPQYKNFSSYPWNKAVLTYRQHIIAHYMLFKSYNTTEESLSVLRVISQFHVRGTPLQIKYLGSRQYERAKKALADGRKGRCLRGPITDAEREQMSSRQIARYSDPENRQKHSLACLGKKHAMTPARDAADAAKRGRQLSADHVARKSKAQSDKYWERIEAGVAKTYWFTPFGVFSSMQSDAVRSLCKKADQPIGPHTVKAHPFLSKKHIGLTPRELGFCVVPFEDIISPEQYRGRLGQAHLPEPTHPLSSELSDYLLQKNFLR